MTQTNDKAHNTPPKKVFIKTYGCQMNVYDSQRMSDSLNENGYQKTDDPEHADLILVNTCHIREKAAEKLYSDLGRLRVQRQKRADNKKLIIGVTGCVAQAEGEEILKRAPVVDLVVGPQTYHRLPQILKNVEAGKKVIDIEYAVEDKFNNLPLASKKTIANRGVSAFLTVQEGCDKFCTFCVVPYTRGAEVSRSFSQIVDEALKLVDAGVKEITLLGQNVNSYLRVEKEKNIEFEAYEGVNSFATLLRAINKIDGIERIRFVSPHPKDFTEDVIEAIADCDKVCKLIHLPLQSTSMIIMKKACISFPS